MAYSHVLLYYYYAEQLFTQLLMQSKVTKQRRIGSYLFWGK